MAKSSKREDIALWLQGKRQAVAAVLAARAALRVTPTVATSLDSDDHRIHNIAQAALSVFRCVAVPWAAAKYPTHGAELAYHASLASIAAGLVFQNTRIAAVPLAAAAANAAASSVSANSSVAYSQFQEKPQRLTSAARNSRLC